MTVYNDFEIPLQYMIENIKKNKTNRFASVQNDFNNLRVSMAHQMSKLKVRHQPYVNLRGRLLFYLFTLGLLQYDYSLHHDVMMIENKKADRPKAYNEQKAHQLLVNTNRIFTFNGIFQLMANMRLSVNNSLAFTTKMSKNRYGGTYHQLTNMQLMQNPYFKKMWTSPKYMDGLSLFLNAIDHIILPTPMTDMIRALFSQLVASTGSQENLFKCYNEFFGDVNMPFKSAANFRNLNKKTMLMKIENDAIFVLENTKLVHMIYTLHKNHKLISGQFANQYRHYNGERIKYDADILFNKHDVNKLIRNVG